MASQPGKRAKATSAPKRQQRPRQKQNSKDTNIVKILGIAVGVLVVAAVGVGAYMLSSGSLFASASGGGTVTLIDSGTIANNMTIEGVDVSGMTPAQAKSALEEVAADLEDDISITLRINDETEDIPGKDIGIHPDIDGAIATAMNVGRTGTMRERVDDMNAGAGNDIKIGQACDESKLRAAISDSELIGAESNEPKATLDKDRGVFEYEDGKDGLEVDTDKLYEMIMKEVTEGTFNVIDVPGERKPSTKSIDDLKAITVQRAYADTRFNQTSKLSAPNRVHNIRTIADKLSGSVVQPGEEFSVNKKVGPRTDPNVWKAAPGIEDGGYTEQLGGGICQVSTTLYQAILRADLRVTTRAPHSIPVAYASKGLDATISTNGPDLRFVNNTDSPIYIYVGVDTGSKTVVCKIFGEPLPDGQTITLEAKVVSTTKMAVEKTTDASKVQAGRDGYVAETYKIYKDKNGKEVKRTKYSTSVYPTQKKIELEKSDSTPSPSASSDDTKTSSTPKPSSTATPTPTATPPQTTSAGNIVGV